MAGPGPICANCHDDRWRLSARGWCDDCEATDGQHAEDRRAGQRVHRATEEGQ